MKAVPGKGEPLGFDGLAHEIAARSTPAWALGGLELSDVPAVVESGAAGLAVRSAVWSHGDPASRIRSLIEAWRAAQSPTELR